MRLERRCKMLKPADCSLTSYLSKLINSRKLKDGQHLHRNSQVVHDTVMNDFNSGQFKIREKEMAAQVDFSLYLNAFLSLELFGACKFARICPIATSRWPTDGSDYWVKSCVFFAPVSTVIFFKIFCNEINKVTQSIRNYFVFKLLLFSVEHEVFFLLNIFKADEAQMLWN